MNLELDLRRKSGLRGEEGKCQDFGCLRLRFLGTAIPDADDDIGNNTCDSAYYDSSEQQRNNAVSIADQRPAGLHPARLGAIPVLRANVQPRRTPTAATTTECWLGLGLVPATIRGW